MFTPPPNFPPFIFLLSDHTTIELAVDVTKALEGLDPTLVAWDFIEPVYYAVGTFVDDTWGLDLGDPRKHPHGDHIKDLATWVENHFGDDYLGGRAFIEAKSKREMGDDSTIVFRDARWSDLKSFLAGFKPHEMLIVNLTTVELPLGEHNVGYKYLPGATSDEIVAAIVEASK